MAAPGQGAQPLTAIDGAPAAKVNGRGGVLIISRVSPPWPVRQPVMKA